MNPHPNLGYTLKPNSGPTASSRFASLLGRAISQRKPLIESGVSDAFRVFGGEADGMDGLYVDVYGSGAILIEYQGRVKPAISPGIAGRVVLDALWNKGVRAVYHKPFSKDRSRMGGKLPEVATSRDPIAGEALPEAFVIAEHGIKLEVRMYDGLSTGLFLDQRENRSWIASGVRFRAASGKIPTVLNTFAYTCAFSVAAAKAGAITTSVDVSARYLDWGKRNFAHNGLDPALHRFAKMDTFEFLGYAARKSLRYDLIVLDPPSFSSGSKKKGVAAWSSADDYGRLLAESAMLLNPKGVIFASTNTAELCRKSRLEREITKAIPRRLEWLTLPPPAPDFATEKDRFAALAFRPH